MIFFLCPDLPYPTGGVKQLHLQACYLQEAGFSVMILYVGSDWPRIWFPTSVPCLLAPRWLGDWRRWRPRLKRWLTAWKATRPAASLPRFSKRLTPRDCLVVPEIFSSGICELPADVPKLILNQSGSLTFYGLVPQGRDETVALLACYMAANVRAVLATSPYIEAYVRWAFPGLPVRCLDLEVEAPVSVTSLDQRPAQLVIFPRKSPEVVQQLFGILRNRQALTGWRIRALEGLSDTGVREVFSTSRLYLACSLQEGLGLPPLEAMAHGCAVAGFPAWGGDGYFTDEFALPVPTGDILALAMAVERILGELLQPSEACQNRVSRARSMVLDRFSGKRARASCLAAFAPFLAGGGARQADACCDP